MQYVMTSKQARIVERHGLNLGDVCNQINAHNGEAIAYLPTYTEVRSWAMRAKQTYKAVIVCANDEIQLMQFGPRGGAKRLCKLTPCSE